jgi:hypothetical protein
MASWASREWLLLWRIAIDGYFLWKAHMNMVFDKRLMEENDA